MKRLPKVGTLGEERFVVEPCHAIDHLLEAVLAEPFAFVMLELLGDGVNTNEIPTQEVFPYVAFAHSGRDSTHNSSCAPNCPQ